MRSSFRCTWGKLKTRCKGRHEAHRDRGDLSVGHPPSAFSLSLFPCDLKTWLGANVEAFIGANPQILAPSNAAQGKARYAEIESLDCGALMIITFAQAPSAI
jgi:hypothetical protein